MKNGSNFTTVKDFQKKDILINLVLKDIKINTMTKLFFFMIFQ